MSGRRAGAGEPGSRGSRAAPSHIAVMQLFHELKQQFPALPDDAVSACIAKHCHDPSICHEQLAQAAAPRSTTYPSCLRTTTMNDDENCSSERTPPSSKKQLAPPCLRTMNDDDLSSCERISPSNKKASAPRSCLRNDDDHSSEPSPPDFSQTSKKQLAPPCLRTITMNDDDHRSERTPPSKKQLGNDDECSSSGCERTPDFPVTNKKPPKPTYDSPTNATTGAIRRSPAVRPASLDLPGRTSDSVDNKTNPAVNLSVNVNCSVGVVDQANGQGPRRHSAVLEVTPEPTWLHSHPPSPRSYTSVNLTLRTPTTPPQGPIDICSSPSSLTYTTSSWDRRQGLQSRLQITVGPVPGVGSVSAVRTRPRSCYLEHEEQERALRAESMPDLTGQLQSTNRVVLLSRQKERKEQLKIELIAGKERLHSIQKEIQALRLENTPEFRTRLKKEIRHLQSQCERLTREVDRHSESRVPLGETNEEFYRHIYTGQRPPLQRRRAPAPRSYAPAATESDNEPRWPCHICTFRNHPLMDKCEQCEMPRVLLGKLAAPSTDTPAAATGNPPHANTPLALGMNS